MAGDTRDATFDLIARDKTKTAVRAAREGFKRLQAQAKAAKKAQDDWSNRQKKFVNGMLSSAKAVGKLTASAAALASTVGPLSSLLIGTAKGIAAVGKAGIALLPLVGFLPSLAGSAGLLIGTLKLAGPGLARALKPITDFVTLGDKSGKGVGSLTSQLQRLIAVGVEPLAAQFAKVNMPAIGDAMKRIATATNGVIRSVGVWLNSIEGQRLISMISNTTAAAMERLAPKVAAVVIAFGNLANRAGDKAINGLANLIGRILDKLAAWADSTTIEDINAALSDLSGYGIKARETFSAIRDIGAWMVRNQGTVKAFSDTIAAAAIVIGLATGNWVAAAAGAATLTLNHFGELKNLFKGAGSWIADLFNKWKNDAGRIAVMESQLNALRSFRDGFRKTTEELGPKWAAFVAAVKSAWASWSPILAAWWNTIGSVIFNLVGQALGVWVKGFLDFATTAIRVFGMVGNAIKAIIPVVLDFIGVMLNGAAKAFGWVPGIGPKLQQAAAEFNAFKDAVNASLNRIDAFKTITIRSTVFVDPTSARKAAGGVDRRTGNSQNAGLSGLTSWQPSRIVAAFMASMTGGGFAMAGAPGGYSRSGGPSVIENDVRVRVDLDGRPFRDYTDRTVRRAEQRQAWRTKVGRR